MKLLIILSATVFWLLLGCNSHTQQTITNAETTNTNTVTAGTNTTALPPLANEERFYKKENPFGEDIALSGKQIVGDTAIFQIKESELTVKNNQLLMKNLSTPVLYIFNLPDLRLQKTAGKRGQAPDEFVSPTLVPSANNTSLGYLFETSLHKLYEIDENGKLLSLQKPFREVQRNAFGASIQLAQVDENDFMYVTDSKTGKSIFHIASKGDEINENEVYRLSLNPVRKSPFAYIGSFAVNPHKNRMAYAYKYFKIIKFMDLEAKTVRTVNFEREGFDENSQYQVNGLDANITHYWGACAGDEYVYFLYSGRTPAQVGKELNKRNYYIFVEKYDWNGNPISRYRLNQWGYFTVDEKNKKIYIASVNHDEPFFEFQF